MSLSGMLVDKTQVSGSIKSILSQIQETLEVSQEEWLSVLKVTPTFYKTLLASQSSVPMEVVLRVAEHYDLSLDAILRNKIDFSVLAERNSGNTTSIPSRYLPFAHSQTQTAIVIFNFLEKKYGSFHSTAVARQLQIRKNALPTDQAINFLFYTDLFAYLNRSYQPDSQLFREMGSHSTQVNQHNKMGALFRNLPSVKDIYERMLSDLMVLYEKNSHYRIRKITPTQCLVECRQNDEIAAGLNVRTLGNGSVCEWKKGVFSSLPGYLGKSHSVVNEIKCVHRGDPVCLFEFSYGDLVTVQ